ncbi:MAG: glycosyltransferase family 2 protein [Bacteroidia bacterium]|nr:glycosyltransferase family 2 protein [Bacteroidia bacterium]
MNNESKKLVSVIVPCFNSAPYIVETLSSVKHQTYSYWECIIINNNSTDNTVQIVSNFIKDDVRFKLIHQEKKGVSAARNKGILESNGEYILPLDGDDLIDKTYIEKCVNKLESNPELKVVYCQADFFGEWKGKWELPAFSIQQMLIENVVFCTAMYKKADFNQTKGYNESMLLGYEDWDFWLGLLKSNNEVFQIQETLFHYRIRKTSRNNALSDADLSKLRKQLYENHKDLYHTHLDISELTFHYFKTKDILTSKEYKIGKLLLSPYRRIKKIIQNFIK